jgi:hypothetical protein
VQSQLRTLLIVTAIAAVCFAWGASVVREYYAEQRIVYGLGPGGKPYGLALLNEGADPICGTGIDVFASRRCVWPSWAKGMARAIGWKYGERVNEIYIGQYAECDESSLRGLKSLRHLESLTIDGYPVTDQCVAELQAALPHCKIVITPAR